MTEMFREAIDNASAGNHRALEEFMVNHRHDVKLPPSLVCWAVNIMFAINEGTPPTVVATFGRSQLGNGMYERMATSWRELLSSSSAPQEVVVP
jgi:hypothetical protein